MLGTGKISYGKDSTPCAGLSSREAKEGTIFTGESGHEEKEGEYIVYEIDAGGILDSSLLSVLLIGVASTYLSYRDVIFEKLAWNDIQ